MDNENLAERGDFLLFFLIRFFFDIDDQLHMGKRFKLMFQKHVT